MISYARLLKRPLLFRSFIGLTVSEFDSIYIDRVKYIMGMKEEETFLTGRRDKEMLLELVDRLSLKSKKDFS